MLKMAPRQLAWNMTKWVTPVPAVLLQSGVCAVLINLSFSNLVVLGIVIHVCARGRPVAHCLFPVFPSRLVHWCTKRGSLS